MNCDAIELSTTENETNDWEKTAVWRALREANEARQVGDYETERLAWEEIECIAMFAECSVVRVLCRSAFARRGTKGRGPCIILPFRQR